MSERQTFKVDQNYHQDSVFLEVAASGSKPKREVLVRSAIETSEFLILTQDDRYDTSKPGVCFVAETGNYTVHGDVVRVCGPIKCPGKSIKIVCRVLQYYPDSENKDAAIIVDGKDGKDGKPAGDLPPNGKDGEGLRQADDIWHSLVHGVDGKVGEPAKPGNNGASDDEGNEGAFEAEDGGTIEIYCEALSLVCRTTLSANGGKGGAGSSGTRGGGGGRGSNGAEILRGGLRGRGGSGAPGSAGGPGGAGSNGGRGGAITLVLKTVDVDSTVGVKMPTLSVTGGDGGAGGKGGDGGRGGDGGTVERYGRSYGKAGRGGPRGPGGKGGYGGKGGIIRIAHADPASAKLKSGVASHGSQGADGGDGADGADGKWDKTPFPTEGRPPRPAKPLEFVPSGPPAQQRALSPTENADSKTDGSVATGQFRYEALRQQVSFGQLRMLAERLRFLFLRLGRADWTVDPEQQNPDLLELLAGIQWIQDLLRREEVNIAAAFRDSLDGAIYFFQDDGTYLKYGSATRPSFYQDDGTYLKYDSATRTLLTPSIRLIEDDWSGLLEDGNFQTVTLGYCEQGLDENFMPKYGGVGMFFKSRDVSFYLLHERQSISGSLKVLMPRGYEKIMEDIDLAVNVTDDGEQGLIFKNGQYYKYTAKKGWSLAKVDGPSSIETDFPGLWSKNVTGAFTGQRDRVFFFQKNGTFDGNGQYQPPQYMIYNLANKRIEPGYPKNIADDWPGLAKDDFTFTGDDRAMAAALLQSANSLSENLRKEKDYFGNTSTYVALETVAFFDKAKREALELLQNAETAYQNYQAAMNKSAQSQSGLQLAVRGADRRRQDIENEAKKTLDGSAAALAKVNQLRDLLDAKGKALAHDAGDLKDRVKTVWGVSWQDLFGCLTQFSFQHWGNLPEKIESGPALMAAGQVGDLFQKGISNVVSDSGQSLSKDYVVKQVDSLTSGIRTLKDLTLNRSKFIDQTNLYNDTYKLMVTRDQFKALCGDFIHTFSVAQKIIDDLDEYVTLADQRNAAVLNYNQLWQRVYDLQAEAVKAELDLHHAQSGLAKKAQPHLPVFTSFATERYNRAKRPNSADLLLGKSRLRLEVVEGA